MAANACSNNHISTLFLWTASDLSTCKFDDAQHCMHVKVDSPTLANGSTYQCLDCATEADNGQNRGDEM